MKFDYSIWSALCLALLPYFGVKAQTTPPSVEYTRTGKLSDPKLGEVSGVVPSRVNAEKLWVHNDSGDGPNLYLIDTSGTLLCTFALDGVEAIDMEDIAWYEDAGRNYLVLGDIGDNRARRKNIRFYVMEEPRWSGQKQQEVDRSGIRTYVVNYPDTPRDAESFFVDPSSKTLYLFSKRDFEPKIFKTDFLTQGEDDTSKRPVLDVVGNFPVFFATSADISTDGSQLLIKNLEHVYYWERKPGQSVVEALSSPFVSLPYKVEPQGEAIAFAPEGTSFYTISERPFGLDSYLYRYTFMTR